ncbi:MAG TPA: hypothetical protein PLV93_05985, partial [Microthrixaceae bacterium]|nr:hypothetical protein [Microthrixaceae bacterium]
VEASVAAVWAGATSSALPAIQLAGAETAAKRSIAGAACAALGLSLSEMSSHATPQAPADLESLARLWEREAALSGSALLLDCDDIEIADAARVGTVTRLVERLNTPLFLATRERLTVSGRPVATFTVERPTVDEQRVIWRQALGPLHLVVLVHRPEHELPFALEQEPVRRGLDVAGEPLHLRRHLLPHDEGPYLGACYAAEEFLRTWSDELPFGRPLA